MNNLDYEEKKKRRTILIIALIILLNIFLILVFATNSGEEESTGEEVSVTSTVDSADSSNDNQVLGDKNIATVATGANFTIALDSSGNVWSWGQNDKGQLGNGDETFSAKAVKGEVLLDKDTQLSNIKQIAAGEYHAAALTDDGKVYMWGYNYFGQTGSTTKRTELYPQLVEVPNGVSVAQIACGADYTLMLTTSGKILGIGDSSDGQLGYYNDLGFTSIRELEESKSSDSVQLSTIKEIAAGYNHVVAIDTNDQVWTWGDTTGSSFEFTQINELTFADGETIQEIEAGKDVSMALSASGKVYTWDLGGTPTEVALGDGVQVRTGTEDNIAIINKTFYIIDANNNVYSWGQNNVGQAGIGSVSSQVDVPTKLEISDDVEIKEIDKVTSSAIPGIDVSGNSEYDTGYAINADGFVLGWGYAGTDIVADDYTLGSNTFRLLGDATRYVANYIGSESIKPIAGNDIILDITADGIANNKDEMNLVDMLTQNGYIIGGRVNLYKNISSGDLSNIDIRVVDTNIATYDDTTGIITGKLQGNTAVEVKTAKNGIYINVQVIGDNFTFAKVESGDNFTVALKADGTVWVWGYNYNLGIIDPDHVNHTGIIVPTQVQGLDKIKDIAIGYDYVLALQEDGTVLGWGANNNGQLGDGTTTNVSYQNNSAVTKIKPTLTKVKRYQLDTVQTQVKVEMNTPTISADGTYYVYTENGVEKQCWTNDGGNSYYDSTGATVIQKDSDGKLYKWESNGYAYENGQTQVVGDYVLENIESISAGYSHALAIDSNGKVWSWGYNGNGEIGIGNTSSIPETLAREVDLRNVVDSTGIAETIKQIEAGYFTSYILTNSGNVYAWGNTGNYQCGMIGGVYYIPTKVTNFGGISKISASDMGGTYALSVQGKVWAFGYGHGYPHTLSLSTNVIDIEATYANGGGIAKFADATVGYWTTDNGAITKVANLDGTEAMKDITLISGGNNFYHVAKADGTVYATGNNTLGQLGNRTAIHVNSVTNGLAKTTDVSKAYIALNKNEIEIKENATEEISATYNHGFNLLHSEPEAVEMTYTSLNTDLATVNGNVITGVKPGITYVVAEDSVTGTELRVKVNVLGADDVAMPAVAVGTEHTVALKTDGSVWGWGYDQCGELGLSSPANINEPTALPVNEKIKQVSAGEDFTLMLTIDGKVLGMGYNGYGQLGNNSRTNSSVPVTVQVQEIDALGNVTYKDLTGITKIIAYNDRSLALDENGNLYAWGNNENTTYATKVNTYGLKVRDISGNLILTEDGRVLEYVYSKYLIYKEGLENIVQISSSARSNGGSYGFYMALDAEGKLYTWTRGSSTYNKVSGTETTTPTEVVFDVSEKPADVRIVDIEAGYKVAYAKDEDGNVYAWGNNAYDGTLGLGDTITAVTTPTKIDTMPNVESIATVQSYTGFVRSFIVANNGSVFGFGRNSNGVRVLLGNADTTEYIWEPKLVGESYAGITDINGNELIRLSIEKGESIDIKAGLMDAFNLRTTKSTLTDAATDFEWRIFNEDLLEISNTQGNTNTLTANQIIGEAIVVAIDKDTQKMAKIYVDVVETDTLVAPKIESAKDHTIALKADGTVWVWGNNVYSQLGLGEENRGATIAEPQQMRIAQQVEVVAPVAKTDGAGNLVLDGAGNQIYVDTDGNEYLQSGTSYIALSGEIKIKQATNGKLYAWDADENAFVLEDILDASGKPIVIVDIATSSEHTLLLTEDGDVYSCGNNNIGQCGDASGATYINVPTKVAALKDIVRIAVGENYSLALDKYGRLWAFGYQYYYNEGTAEYPITSNGSPQRVNEILDTSIEDILKGTVDITNGYVLTKDGEAISLGLYENSKPVGTVVEGITGKVIKITKTSGNAADFGYEPYYGHTAFLTDEGTLYTMGYGTKGQLGNDVQDDSVKAVVQVKKYDNSMLDNIRDVYVGGYHTVAISKDGEIYTWGTNEHGQLRNEPSRVSNIVPRAYPTEKDDRITNAILVAAGDNFTVALDETGYAYAWGLGSSGQLGNGLTIENNIEAVLVGRGELVLDENHITLQENGSSVEINAENKMLNLIYDVSVEVDTPTATDSSVVSTSVVDSDTIQISPVSAGNTSVVVKPVGKDYVSIIEVTVLPEIAEVNDDITIPADAIIKPMTVSGESHTLILKADGTVWAYGDNTFGQTGATDKAGNTIEYTDKVLQVKFPDGTLPIISVAAGNDFSVALDMAGNVYTWGYNGQGQLGLGYTSTKVMTPTKVNIAEIVKVVAGANQVLAIDEEGYVYAWGKNSSGSLGIGSTANVRVPTRIPNVVGVIDVAAGKEHAVLVTANGEVYTTGRNIFGQLGKEDILSRVNFEKIEIGEKIAYIAAGGSSNLAIDINGNVWAWGDNENGQLGLGLTETIISVPTQVTGINKAQSISVGENHTHVVTSNNVLYVAGSNSYGQLGIGNTTDKTNQYVQVSKLGSRVMNSDAGTTYSTAIATDGTVFGFGDYNHGNLERTSLTNSFEPVMISDNTSYLDEQEIVVNLNGNYTLNPNGKYKLNVLRKDNSTFTFESTNSDIATVDSQGVITGTSVGTTTVKAIDEDGKVNTVIVRVIPEDASQAPTIEGGNGFTVVTNEYGTAYGFGNKENITETSIPVMISDAVSFITTRAGENFEVAINADGTIWSWGENDLGQLGLIDHPGRMARLNNMRGFLQVDAGNKHAIALNDSGAVYVWGDNSNGQLGLGADVANVNIPTVIKPIGARVISVAAGGNYSAVVDTNGVAYIIGNGSIQEVPAITGVVEVAVGENYTYMLTNEGKVYRISNTNTMWAPTQMTGEIADKVIVDIEANKDVLMCLASDKTLYTCGNNEYGQLASDSILPTVNSLTKVAENVFRMGTGYNNTYYINTEGSVYAAGTNTSGELGNGTKDKTESPTHELSRVYVLVGNSKMELDPDAVRVSTAWSILVGDEKLKENLPDKTKAVTISKTNGFNVFGNTVVDLGEYDFEITDTTLAEITEPNTLKVVTKALGETILKVTNKVTKEEAELDIYIVSEELLRLEDMYVIDSGNTKYESKVSGTNKFLIDIEGATNSGTLTLELSYDDTVEVVDSEGTSLTATKDPNTNKWVVSGLDLTKAYQELKLTLTATDGTPYEFVIVIYRNAIVKVNEEILSPKDVLNKQTGEREKVYTKYVDPADTTANVKIFMQNEENTIKLEDSNGNELATAGANIELSTVVNIPNLTNKFIIKTINTKGEVEEEYVLQILKSSIETVYVIDTKVIPQNVLASRKDGEAGTGYVEEFTAEINDVNDPANITINLGNKNVTGIKVDEVDKTADIVNSKLILQKDLPAENETIVIKLEITAIDPITLEEYTEKHKIVIDPISSNANIEVAKILVMNAITQDPPYESSKDDDDPLTHEIILHKSIDIYDIRLGVVLESDKAKVSVTETGNYKPSDSEFDILNGIIKETDNKYKVLLWVQPESGGNAIKNTLYIYKESENADIEKIDITSPASQKTETATKEDGTDTYIGKVQKGETGYEIEITLEDSYSKIESITIDGVTALSTYLTEISGANGKYTYNATRDILGKIITIVVKPEYDGAPTKEFKLKITEMDDNAQIEYIKVDNTMFTDMTLDSFAVDVKSADKGELTVKAESSTATVEIFAVNPDTDSTAQSIASGTGKVENFAIPFNGAKTKTLYIRTTAEDGTKGSVKTLTATKLSNNANILKITATETAPLTNTTPWVNDAKVDPTDNSVYILDVYDTIEKADITVTLEDSNATVDLDGQTNGSEFDLTITNSIDITVTPEDGENPKDYTLKINRVKVNTDFDKELVHLTDDGNIIKKNDAFKHVSGTNVYSVDVNDDLGTLRLKIEPEYTDAKVEMKISKIGTVAQTNSYVEGKTIQIDTSTNCEVMVRLTPIDGIPREYLIKINSIHRLLTGVTVTGYDTDTSTTLDTKTVTAEQIKAGSAEIRINPDSDKATVALNSEYQPVTGTYVITHPGMTDPSTGADISAVTGTFTINSTSGTSFDVELLADMTDVANVQITITTGDGTYQNLTLNITRGSTDAVLDKVELTNANDEDDKYVAQYLNPTKETNEIVINSNDSVFDMKAICAENGTATIYQLDNGTDWTQVHKDTIDLTQADDITENSTITVTKDVQTFIILVKSEYGDNEKRYRLTVRKVCDDSDLVNMDIEIETANGTIINKKLTDFDPTLSNKTITVLVPRTATKLTMSNVTLNSEYAKAKWTDMTLLTKTDSDYTLYGTGDTKTCSNVMVEPHMQLRVIAENEQVNEYRINIETVSEVMALTSIELRETTSNVLVSDTINKEDQEVKVKKTVTSADVTAVVQGVVELEIAQVNGVAIDTKIATQVPNLRENTLNIDLNRNYTDTAGNVIDKSALDNILVKVTVYSTEYYYYPEGFAGKDKSEYSMEYFYLIDILRTDTSMQLDFENSDGTIETLQFEATPSEDITYSGVENGIPVYERTKKIPASQTEITIKNVKTKLATVSHGFATPGSELYIQTSYVRSIGTADKATVTEDFIVEAEDGTKVIYRLTVIKKSGNTDIGPVTVNGRPATINGGVTTYDVAAAASNSGFTYDMLSPVDNLVVNVADIEENATVEIYIAELDNEAVTVSANEPVKYGTPVNGLKTAEKDLIGQLNSILASKGKTQSDVSSILIYIDVTPEDTDLGATRYELYISVQKSSLISVDGLNTKGEISADVQLTSSDFHAVSGQSGVFETDVIVVPSAVSQIHLTNILCEDDDLVTVTDKDGFTLTDRSLTIDVASNGVTTATIKVSLNGDTQTFNIRVRKASVDANIKEVIAYDDASKEQDRTDTQDAYDAYVLYVKSTVDPEIEVKLNDSTAKVVSAEIDGTQYTVNDNKFTLTGLKTKHDDSETEKTVNVKIKVQPEDTTVDPDEYIITLVKRHTETGLGKVEYAVGSDTETVTFANTDVLTVEIPSNADGIDITSIEKVCNVSTVYVNDKLFDGSTGLLPVAEGTQQSIIIKVVSEYGDAIQKQYTLNVKRLSSNTNLNNITVNSKAATLDEVNNIYTANIKITENSTIAIQPANSTIKILGSTIKVYKAVAGDLTGVVVQEITNTGFKIVGLSSLYVDDATEHAGNNENRVIMVEFDVVAEDPNVTETYKIQITRQHVEKGIPEIDYSYTETLTGADGTTPSTEDKSGSIQLSTTQRSEIIVGSSVEHVDIEKIIPNCEFSEVAITINGTNVVQTNDGFSVDLSETTPGDGCVKTVVVTVTSESGESQSYILDIIRKASNASLYSVLVKGIAATKEPSPEEGIEAIFKADILDTDTSVIIDAWSANTDAVVSITDTNYTTNGNNSYYITGTYDLANAIASATREIEVEIKVQPEDTTLAPKVYKLIMTRRSTDNLLEQIEVSPVVDGITDAPIVLTDNADHTADFAKQLHYYSYSVAPYYLAKVDVPTKWTEISIGNISPEDRTILGISRISNYDPYSSSVLSSYTIGDTFTMPEGEDVYFKVETESESGIKGYYVIHLYKKATSAELVDTDSVLVNTKPASYKVEDEVYYVNVNANDNQINIVVNAKNKLYDTSMTKITSITSNGTDVMSRLGLSGQVSGKQAQFKLNDVYSNLDFESERVLVVQIEVQPEDEESDPKQYTIQITRQHTNTNVEHIFINAGETVSIDGLDKSIEQIEDGTFTLNPYNGRYEKHINVSSQRDYAIINDIELECGSASKTITVGEDTYTEADFPITVSLPSEGDSETIKVTIKPEYEGEPSVERYIVIRRKYSDDTLKYLKIERQYIRIETDDNGNETGVVDTDREKYITADVNDPNKYSETIFIDQDTTIITTQANKSYARIEMSLVDILDKEGNSIKTGNELTNITWLYNTSYYGTKTKVEHSRQATLDTSVGRTFIVKFIVQSEDLEVPAEEYTLTLIKLDDSAEIKQILGNDVNVEIDKQLIHYKSIEKTEVDNTIYTQYIDADVTEVLTDIITVSEFATIYVNDQKEGQGKVEDYKVSIAATDTLTEVLIKVKSEDEKTEKEYRLWYIKKSDDASIGEVWVDGEQVPVNDDGNYEWTISDITEFIDVRMIPNYDCANVAINMNSFAWREALERIAIGGATLVDGRIAIELRVNIPAEQSSTGEAINNVKWLYITRVATENTIKFISTDNYNDDVSPEPFSGYYKGEWKYKQMYEVLLEATEEERTHIDIKIEPVSPLATVELWAMDGTEPMNSGVGTLLTEGIELPASGILTLEVKVIPDASMNTPKTYYIEVVPKSDRAELETIRLGDNYYVDLVPGKYDYIIDREQLQDIGDVYAKAKYDELYGKPKVKIYTVTGYSEEDLIEATLFGIDFANTKYISITVEAPNLNNTRTYQLLLEDLSYNALLESVIYNKSTSATFNVSTDANYEGEYIVDVDPEQELVDIVITAEDPNATVEVNGQSEQGVLTIQEDVSNMTTDIVRDIIVTAESGHTFKYKLIIRKQPVLSGRIITENVDSNYAGVEVQVLDNQNQLVSTGLTEEDGTFNIRVPEGDNYKVVIKKEGYLKHTITNIPATYGIKTNVGVADLIAGEVAASDEYIDLRDLVQVNNRALANNGIGTHVDGTNGKYDFNEDGVINNIDLSILIKNYNKKAVEVQYTRNLNIKGEVVDSRTNDLVPNARIQIGKATLANEYGRFDLANVPLGTHTIIVKDKDGNVIGESSMTIEEGTEEKIDGNVITVTPNTGTVNIRITVNGTIALISKDGEKPELDMTAPEEVELTAEIVEDGIKLKVTGTDENLSKVTFYKEDVTEDSSIVLTKISSIDLTGTTVNEEEIYKLETITFNELYRFSVVVEDTSGNKTTANEEIADTRIGTATDWNKFADAVNGSDSFDGQTVTLACDLDFQGQTVKPVGKSTGKPFKGTFDGAGHKIYNLDISGGNYVGLFGAIQDATIKNIGIESGEITATGLSAGIVGYATGTSKIENSYNKANITASGNSIGGIVGHARGTITIQNSYNAGNISGVNQIGGIIGYVEGTSGTIKNCYNIGTITGTSDIGEIIGYRRATVDSNEIISTITLENCYYLDTATNPGVGKISDDVTSSIQTEMDKLNDATPVSDATNLLAGLGNAFKADFATPINNGYPILDWEEEPQTATVMSLRNSQFVLPINADYVITSEFGTRSDVITEEEENGVISEEQTEMHYGMDIAADYQTPILAIADGTVTFAGENGNYGYCIEIKHEVNGEIIYSFYAHLNRIDVQVGDTVAKGQQIGLEGGIPGEPGAGSSTGAHLHLEIRKISGSYSSAVDPRNYLEF